MASFKLNIGRITGCPAAATLAEKMNVGVDGQRFGVLDLVGTAAAVKCRLLRLTNKPAKVWDEAKGAIVEVVERKAEELPLTIFPQKGTIELTAGSAKALEHIETFLTDELGLSVVVEPIEMDVLGSIEKLRKDARKFQLVSGTIELFSANSFTLGTYRPKFEDTENGMEFLEKHAAAVKDARVRFAAKNGRVNLVLTSLANYAFSCREDDRDGVIAMVRELALE